MKASFGFPISKDSPQPYEQSCSRMVITTEDGKKFEVIDNSPDGIIIYMDGTLVVYPRSSNHVRLDKALDLD